MISNVLPYNFIYEFSQLFICSYEDNGLLLLECIRIPMRKENLHFYCTDSFVRHNLILLFLDFTINHFVSSSFTSSTIAQNDLEILEDAVLWMEKVDESNLKANNGGVIAKDVKLHFDK